MDQHFPRCVHPVGSVDHRHHFSSSQAAPGRAEHRSQICSVPGNYTLREKMVNNEENTQIMGLEAKN